MSLSQLISDHTFLFGLLFVGGFLIWKYIIQPIMNEGEPLDPEIPPTIEEQLGLNEIKFSPSY